MPPRRGARVVLTQGRLRQALPSACGEAGRAAEPAASVQPTPV